MLPASESVPRALVRAFGVGLIAAVANTGVAMASGEFVLEITGNAEARVEVSCELDAGSERYTEHLSGATPLSKRMSGESVACTIRQTAQGGRIDVSLSSPTGNRQRLGTGGAGSTLRVNMQ